MQSKSMSLVTRTCSHHAVKFDGPCNTDGRQPCSQIRRPMRHEYAAIVQSTSATLVRPLCSECAATMQSNSATLVTRICSEYAVHLDGLWCVRFVVLQDKGRLFQAHKVRTLFAHRTWSRSRWCRRVWSRWSRRSRWSRSRRAKP